MTNKQPIKLIDVEEKESFDLTAIREKLSESKGKQYWRSLDELAQNTEFQSYLHHEFPHWAEKIIEPVTRRNFLRFMGASMAMVGLSGCTANSILHPQPLEKIAPYTRQPEQVVQGKALYFATAMTVSGFAKGLIAKSHMGRPIKLEGNPTHPASLGATDVYSQASILTMYDPERAQAVKNRGRISSWDTFRIAFNETLSPYRAGQNGNAIRILTETVTSPTLANQIEQILEAFPGAEWYQYEPVNRDNINEGAALAFGEYVNTYYDLTQAKVIVALDADFLTVGPASVRYARDFTNQRRLAGEGASEEMNRLYVAESRMTGTGGMADHRQPVAHAEVDAIARQMAAALGVLDASEVELSEELTTFVETMVADLQANAGECVVIAGDYQPPAVHALAHLMNDALGNVGTTVIHTDPVEANPINQAASLQTLVDQMMAGQVDLLIMIDGNPVFNAPADMGFAEAIENVGQRIHLTVQENETSRVSQWVIPQADYLERWGDARAYDGTVSIVQPLIAPLYDGHSAHRLLALMLEDTSDDYDIVHDYWQSQSERDDFEDMWQITLHDGVMAESALATKAVSVQTDIDLPAPQPVADLEVTFRPDPTIWDGRYANNGWLQELPKPVTKLTWDNAALISPRLAEERGLNNGDLVTLTIGDNTLEIPVWILPGQPHNSIAIDFGYGRTSVGQVGAGTGFNAFVARTSDTLWSGAATLAVTGGYYSLVSTQNHSSMEGRDIVRYETLDEFLHGHDDHHGHHYQSLMAGHPYDGHHWGMSVDLGSCIGCNACVAACNAENNIAIVGKDEVAIGREMHWMRIDRYFEGDLDNPKMLNQPLMCQHCEQAPCEVVCPVAATVHSAEGLNDMVYNRCVGTRFCANNCPYKVRRFNYYQYQEVDVPVIELRHNPNVTVRPRGVMEKCTYCVQRINHARIEAKKQFRMVEDGEIVTACQQACPTQAIVFGDISDENSRVHELRESSLTYSLLEELNTKPRTTYLTRVTNPNPAIEQGEA